jgi:hypothetical protein
MQTPDSIRSQLNPYFGQPTNPLLLQALQEREHRQGLLASVANLAAQFGAGQQQTPFGTVDADAVLKNPLFAASYRQAPEVAAAAYKRATGEDFGDILKEKQVAAKDKQKAELDTIQKVLTDSRVSYDPNTGKHMEWIRDPTDPTGQMKQVPVAEFTQSLLDNAEKVRAATGSTPSYLKNQADRSAAAEAARAKAAAELASVARQRATTPNPVAPPPSVPISTMHPAQQAAWGAQQRQQLVRNVLSVPAAGLHQLERLATSGANMGISGVNFLERNVKNPVQGIFGQPAETVHQFPLLQQPTWEETGAQLRGTAPAFGTPLLEYFLHPEKYAINQ